MYALYAKDRDEEELAEFENELNAPLDPREREALDNWLRR